MLYLMQNKNKLKRKVNIMEVNKSICPICGKPTEIRVSDDVEILYCTNSNCEAKLINQLDHFAGKKGLDIKGLSKATLEKLINWGWVEKIDDLFELKIHRAEWVKQAGFGAKSVDNILNAIEASKRNKCTGNIVQRLLD